MTVPLLSRLRGADGRSLAKALALFLFLNTLLSGLHTGFAAGSPDEGFVICNLASPAMDGGIPAEAKDHRHDCCAVGSGFVPQPTASSVSGAWRQANDNRAPTYVTAILATRLVLASEGPRGPPVLV